MPCSASTILWCQAQADGEGEERPWSSPGARPLLSRLHLLTVWSHGRAAGSSEPSESRHPFQAPPPMGVAGTQASWNGVGGSPPLTHIQPYPYLHFWGPHVPGCQVLWVLPQGRTPYTHARVGL